MLETDTIINVETPPERSLSYNNDSRSFKASSLAETNVLKNYKPLAFRYTKRDGTPGECPLGLGNSAQDLVRIFICYVVFYSFLVGMVALMLQGALDTDVKHTLLWAYLVFGLLFSGLVGGAIYVGRKNLNQKKSEKRAAAKRANKVAK